MAQYVAVHQVVLGNNEVVMPGAVLKKISESEASELLALGAIAEIEAPAAEAPAEKKPAAKKAVKGASGSDPLDPFSE